MGNHASEGHELSIDMIVDIRGTQTGNKGAQLMLEAIVERLESRFILSAQTHLTDYDVRSHLGLRQTLHHYAAPRASQFLSNYVPERFRRPYGLVSDSELGAVLDASGFAYSDQWGPARARTEALFGRRQFARGVPKVLLPQAFGPFGNSDVRKWSLELLNQSTLVFARDRLSEAYLKALGPKPRVFRAPDFTIGLSASAVELPLSVPYFAIVPNARVLDRGGQSRGEYLSGLGALARAARAEGLELLVVVHETQDQELARQLADDIDAAVFRSERPRELKYVLGHATAAVSSRFHALVGALSQGVPALAWGWSHKYGELLQDFGVSDWSVQVDEPDAAARVRQLLSDSERARLGLAVPDLVAEVGRMWSLTEEAIGS